MSAHTAFWWVLNGGSGSSWVKFYLIGPTAVVVWKDHGIPTPLAQAVRFTRPSKAKRFALRTTERREENGYTLSQAGVWVGQVEVDLPNLEQTYSIPRTLERQIASLTGQMASNGRSIES